MAAKFMHSLQEPLECQQEHSAGSSFRCSPTAPSSRSCSRWMAVWPVCLSAMNSSMGSRDNPVSLVDESPARDAATHQQQGRPRHTDPETEIQFLAAIPPTDSSDQSVREPLGAASRKRPAEAVVLSDDDDIVETGMVQPRARARPGSPAQVRLAKWMPSSLAVAFRPLGIGAGRACV
jgi:hypothetical protein